MRRRWHREPRTRKDLERFARQARRWFGWLVLSAVLQVGTVTLIWELTFPLLLPGDAPRTGFLAGMSAPRRRAIPPPEVPLLTQEPEPPEPPEEPPPIEVDPLEAPEEAPERGEGLEEAPIPEWEPEEAAEIVLVAFRRVTGGRRGTMAGGGRHALRSTRPPALTENAVALGLRWLAAHQDVDEDGRWDCDGFMKHDPHGDQCDGAGGAHYDVGITGLALMAFLGAGHTGRGGSPYTRHVHKGLRYLMRSQTADGVLGTRAARKFIYNHAIGTLALCEALWRSRNPRYRRPAQRAVDLIAIARNPYLAWRYEPRGGENDTAVTTWCLLALQAGRRAGLAVDPDAFEGARQWIHKMTDPEFGRVGYNFPGGLSARPAGLRDRFPPEKSHAMTAAGMLCRLALGENPRASEPVQRGADLCAALPPVWNPDDGSIDMYYWYFGTRALSAVGGQRWSKWSKSLHDAVLRSQHREGSGTRTGSWDPIGVHGSEGGRIYATALLTMCLGTLPPPR